MGAIREVEKEHLSRQVMLGRTPTWKSVPTQLVRGDSTQG